MITAGAASEGGAASAKSVLVVDDDLDVRESIADALRDEGFPVRTASNGREALSALREGPAPGLILLDLSMPVMSGTELRRVQLGDPALARIPTAVISAAGSLQPMIQGLGIELVLPKPFSLDQLLGLADRFCR